MSKLVLPASALVAFLLSAGTLAGQPAPPSTDIFLAPIRMQNDKPTVGRPSNITHRAGYDNQPSFTADSRSLLFTSGREDAQADIDRYDLRTRATSRITSTTESEYSATVFGDAWHRLDDVIDLVVDVGLQLVGGVLGHHPV